MWAQNSEDGHARNALGLLPLLQVLQLLQEAGSRRPPDRVAMFGRPRFLLVGLHLLKFLFPPCWFQEEFVTTGNSVFTKWK